MNDFVKTPGGKDFRTRVIVTLGTKLRAVRLEWTTVHTRKGAVHPVFKGEVPAGAVKVLQDDQERMEEGSNEASINMIRVCSLGLLRKPFQLRVEVHRRGRGSLWFDGILRPGMIRNAWEIMVAREPVRIVSGEIVFNSLGRFDDHEDFEALVPLIGHAVLPEQTALEPAFSFGRSPLQECGGRISGDLPLRVPAPFQNYVVAWRAGPFRHRTMPL